jgi:hypothetical protein
VTVRYDAETGALVGRTWGTRRCGASLLPADRDGERWEWAAWRGPEQVSGTAAEADALAAIVEFLAAP